MAKLFGWVFFLGLAFSVWGFLFDWVDISKNKDEQRIEFYLNTGKVCDDVSTWYNTTADFIGSF